MVYALPIMNAVPDYDSQGARWNPQTDATNNQTIPKEYTTNNQVVPSGNPAIPQVPTFGSNNQIQPYSYVPNNQIQSYGYAPNNQIQPNGYAPNNQFQPFGYAPNNQIQPYGYVPNNHFQPYGYAPNNQIQSYGNAPNNQFQPYGYAPYSQIQPYGNAPHNLILPYSYGNNTQVTPNGSSFNQIMPQTMISSTINQHFNNNFQEPIFSPIVQVPTYPKITMKIYCSPCIRHSDISAFIRNYLLSDKDKRVSQGVYTLLNKEAEWVWGNAAIEVHGENIEITFHSGNEANKFVVHLDENDGVSSSCRARGLRLYLRDGVVSIWNFIKDAASAVSGALTLPIRRMLTSS